MIAYTDAGFTKSSSYSHHAYIIMDDNGKIIKKRKFKAFENTPINAERRSIEKLIQDTIHMGLDIHGMTIYSDCKYLVDTVNNGYANLIECDYLKFLVKSTGAKLNFIHREHNKKADKLVKSVKKPRIRKGLLIS